jgi:hypothetical protein
MACNGLLKLSGLQINQSKYFKMKKIFLLPVILFYFSLVSNGQAPQAFKYQAVIRDTTGSVIANQLVSLRISIIKGDINGETAYSEIHDITTNSLGLVNLEIGRGLALEGEFAGIPWGEDSFYIKLEIDMIGAMNYQLLGISQLLAVPYALYAETSGSGSTPDTVISQWKDTAEGIYYNEGNVGIGTSAPVSNLQIEGTSVYTGNRRFLQIRNNSIDSHSAVVLWMNSGAGNSSTFLAHHAASYNLYGGKYAETSQLWNDGQGLFFRTRPESKFIFETYDGGQYSDPKEVMRLTGDGKLGLGTENPEVPLHIVGTSSDTEGRTFLLLNNKSTDENSNVNLVLESGNGSSHFSLHHLAESYSLYGYKYASTSILWNIGNGMILRTNPEGRISFESADSDGRSLTELMRLTGDGKLGLGTENPEALLQIEGTSVEEEGRLFLLIKNRSVDNFSTATLKLTSGNGNSATDLVHLSETYSIFGGIYADASVLWNSGKGLVLRTNTDGRISFETTDPDGRSFTEHMRMTGDGKFGIGTLAPQRTLHVNDVMRLEPRSTPPDNPAEGDIYMDSSDHHLKVFDGELWQSCW